LNILVNNAGIFENLKSTHQQEPNDWQRIIDVNLRGAFLMAQEASSVMHVDSIGGVIINIASVAGQISHLVAFVSMQLPQVYSFSNDGCSRT